MSRWSWSAGLVVVIFGVAGCTKPPQMVPVAPPGLEYSAVAPEETSEDDVAEALGEQRLQGAAQGQVPPPIAATNAPIAEPTTDGAAATTSEGLKYETLQPGSGEVATPGKLVTVHYTGTLTNGREFDSSRKGEPLKFRLGSRQVIQGWDLGVAGMKVGERRKLTIPPDLAYGPSGQGPIPPNATLVFDVELLKVE